MVVLQCSIWRLASIDQVGYIRYIDWNFRLQMTVHQPTIKQLQYLVPSPARPFRRGGGGLLCHPVDPFCGVRELEACSASPWSSGPGASCASRARRADRRQGVRVIQESEELAEMARAKASRCTASSRHGRDPDHRALPSAGHASQASPRMAGPRSSICARKPARRPARHFIAASSTACCLPSVHLRRRGSEPLFDDRLFVAFPRGEAPRAAGRCRPRSTRSACCSSRTAIA